MNPTDKRIAKNSILLFIRMGVLMLINILAVRFVRNGLGSVEYGIFTAVTGIAQLVICLNTVLASASQRFFSVALGEHDMQRLRDCFRVSVRLSWYLAGIFLVLFETVGLWFVCSKMQYPPERLGAVLWSYQAAILTLLSTLVQVPYLAAVMAREKMDIYTIVSLLEGGLKLALAIGLIWCPWDKLVVYSFGLAVFSTLSTIIYVLFCRHSFPETRHQSTDTTPVPGLYHEMLVFSGWTMFGSLAGTLMMQGNLLLLNVYYGPVVNGAFAISMQVFGAFLQLGNNILIAIRPQMVMSYSEGNQTHVNRLFIRGSQLLLSLMTLVAIPFLIWMPDILRLWLGDTDATMVTFCRLMILNILIQLMGSPFTVVMQAANRVKEYHLVVEIFTIACFPLSWIALSLGAPAEVTVWIIIVCCMLAHLFRMERLYRYYDKAFIKPYCLQVGIPMALVCTLIISWLLA